jgi:hypothetical protein
MKGNARIIALMHVKLKLPPVAIPARSKKASNAGSLSGAQEEELAIEVHYRSSCIGTDDSVDPIAGLIQSINIPIVLDLDKALQLRSLFLCEFIRRPTKASDLVPTRGEALDQM